VSEIQQGAMIKPADSDHSTVRSHGRGWGFAYSLAPCFRSRSAVEAARDERQGRGRGWRFAQLTGDARDERRSRGRGGDSTTEGRIGGVTAAREERRSRGRGWGFTSKMGE